MTDEIMEQPFDWNDNLSEMAQEDFSMIRQSLPYGTATSIGMALAKLELLERQGCKVEEGDRGTGMSALYSINPKDQNSILYDGAFHNGILKSLEIIDKHIANLQQ